MGVGLTAPRPWAAPLPARAASVGRARSVTAVVCLAFDAAGDDAVLAVRDRLLATGIVLPTRPAHRPHVTLGAVRVHPAQVPDVVALVDGVAAEASSTSFALPLTRVGRFGRAGALWLGPSGVPAALRGLHTAVDAALTASSVGERAFAGRTAPGAWVPHCSLATRLAPADLERGRQVVAAGFAPVPTRAAGLAVILVGGSGDVGLVALTEAGGPGGPADDDTSTSTV